MMAAGSNHPASRPVVLPISHRPGRRIEGAALGELPEQDVPPSVALRVELLDLLTTELWQQRRFGGLSRDIDALKERLADLRRERG